MLEETFSDNGELSPWRLRIIGIVMVLGFGVLLAITVLAHRNAPPIPGKVVDAQGTTLFTKGDIGAGQAVFLKYELMVNGSIWGHGAYLGPDFSAEAQHRMGVDTANALAHDQFDTNFASLDPMQYAASRAQVAVAVALKRNRYQPDTDTLSLTPAETLAWRQQLGYWTNYFKHPASNGGLKANLITDTQALHEFTAFFHLGGVGVGGQTAGGKLLVHLQFSL